MYTYKTLTDKERVKIYEKKDREARTLRQLKAIQSKFEQEVAQIMAGEHHEQAQQLSFF